MSISTSSNSMFAFRYAAPKGWLCATFANPSTHLLGEHAAVHVAEAIAFAINLRTTATVAESNQS